MGTWPFGRFPPAAGLLAVALAAAGTVAQAATGSLSVLWDANTVDADVAGYRVFVATDPGVFNLSPAAARLATVNRTVAPAVTEATFSSLDGGRTYYVAVTAYDTSGNESAFSAVVSGGPGATPVLISVAPGSARQGSRGAAVTLTGSSLRAGAVVGFGPGIDVRLVDDAGAPARLVAVVDVGPLAALGPRDVTVTDPSGSSSTLAAAFEVEVDPDRVDINGSSRVDGGDLVQIAAAFAARAGEPAYSTAMDLDVDGVINGFDVAILISYFGSVGPF